MPAIAQSAGIALDTVYASVGKKPALFALLVETAISGTDVAIPAAERDYVRAIRAEPDPRGSWRYMRLRYEGSRSGWRRSSACCKRPLRLIPRSA